MKNRRADIESIDHSQSGWRIRSDRVELFVTRNGGQVAPVTFNVGQGRTIQPYYISPWQNEGIGEFAAPVLGPLRGDFFCMPFGANLEKVHGERHPAHGEPASAPWQFVDFSENGGITTLTLACQTTARSGKITKKIHLCDGQNVVYTTHILEGYSGQMPIAHHCTLDVPEDENSMRIAVSEFEMGMTAPTLFSNPAHKEYQSLAIGETFTDLTKVPVIWKDTTPADCTSFPQRIGFTDLLQIFKKPSTRPAWTVAICPGRGYLWYSFKDASLLPGTVFWISNKGRHGSPWNGRNRCLGLEETCSYFADGLGPSTEPNLITESGFPTAVELSASKPTHVNFIQGAAKITSDFTKVEAVKFNDKSVTFISVTGDEVAVGVDYTFLESGHFSG